MIRAFKAGFENWRFVEIDDTFTDTGGVIHYTQPDIDERVVFISVRTPKLRRELIEWKAIAEVRQLVAMKDASGIVIHDVSNPGGQATSSS